MVNNFISDSDLTFDNLLPIEYQEVSKVHWTPARIIERAVEWLVELEVEKVLDIGSGVGKFCLLGAQHSNINFIGIEKRKKLVDIASKLQNDLEVSKVEFLNKDVVDVDFSAFNAFYYFNPFCEQICISDWIDKDISFSPINYLMYESHVYSSFLKADKGTKVIKYCSDNFELPQGYILDKMDFDNLLQLWVKK